MQINQIKIAALTDLVEDISSSFDVLSSAVDLQHEKQIYAAQDDFLSAVVELNLKLDYYLEGIDNV